MRLSNFVVETDFAASKIYSQNIFSCYDASYNIIAKKFKNQRDIARTTVSSTGGNQATVTVTAVTKINGIMIRAEISQRLQGVDILEKQLDGIAEGFEKVKAMLAEYDGLIDKHQEIAAELKKNEGNPIYTEDTLTDSFKEIKQDIAQLIDIVDKIEDKFNTENNYATNTRIAVEDLVKRVNSVEKQQKAIMVILNQLESAIVKINKRKSVKNG